MSKRAVRGRERDVLWGLPRCTDSILAGVALSQRTVSPKTKLASFCGDSVTSSICLHAEAMPPTSAL
jgi:hypothetical protein